ncbi:hypothetical protein [Klebsiella aerogenes]|uniref:hypothetical protein n=1 Tax=Klebsiella aerogenes TaxID=548 RepID=UPI003C12B626
MTKNGNRSLRTLIIHGARSVMRSVKKRDDSLIFCCKGWRPVDRQRRPVRYRRGHRSRTLGMTTISGDIISMSEDLQKSIGSFIGILAAALKTRHNLPILIKEY